MRDMWQWQQQDGLDLLATHSRPGTPILPTPHSYTAVLSSLPLISVP
jgi:hypothetical protein